MSSRTSHQGPEPRDPQFADRVMASFAKQGIMATIGARLVSVTPGAVEIALPVAAHVSQQHGFVHAGVVATIADSAAGYAALSLMLLKPAAGDALVARGRVVKAGRTLTLAMTEVFAVRTGHETLCALLTATLMTIEGRDGVSD
jgi:uncharacterized protein (TIGR00369 family)